MYMFMLYILAQSFFIKHSLPPFPSLSVFLPLPSNTDSLNLKSLNVLRKGIISTGKSANEHKETYSHRRFCICLNDTEFNWKVFLCWFKNYVNLH